MQPATLARIQTIYRHVAIETFEGSLLPRLAQAATQGEVGLAAFDPERKARNIAETLDLLVRNGDLIERLRPTIRDAHVPLYAEPFGREFHATVRQAVLMSVQEGCTMEWDETVAEGWDELVDVVLDATFGSPGCSAHAA